MEEKKGNKNRNGEGDNWKWRGTKNRRIKWSTWDKEKGDGMGHGWREDINKEKWGTRERGK